MHTPRKTDAPINAEGRAQRLERLSSLVDGEVVPDAIEDACGRWRQDHRWRDDWHLYHLIGDALRSDELCRPSHADGAFMRGLRERLAVEPVPLAPAALAPIAARARQPRRWLVPAAAVAGFMAVGAAVVVLRSADSGAESTLARAPSAAAPSVVSSVAAVGSASAPNLVIDGQLIRDARLDAYFDNHRSAAVAMPSAVPGGALRSVDMVLPQR